LILALRGNIKMDSSLRWNDERRNDERKVPQALILPSQALTQQ
jgi:hypothetical protein